MNNLEILKFPTKGLRRKKTGLYYERINGRWFGYERLSRGSWELWESKLSCIGEFEKLSYARLRAQEIANKSVERTRLTPEH